MNLPGYDDWKLSEPEVDEKWERFCSALKVKEEEEEYRKEYVEVLIDNGALDDDLADYDEDKFWEWVYENKFEEGL